MKNRSNISKVAGTLLVAAMLTLAQSGFALKETANVPFSPILINGMPFYGSEITMDARGSLAVVDGFVISNQVKKVPFRAYLKREGVVINRVYSENSRTEGVVEVSQVLAGARTGDKLIIESGSADQKKVQRVINVAGYTMIRWFRIPGQPGDGC
jgi:hypothetical protein